MSKKNSSNVEPVERRKNWRDRRLGDDRRNSRRLELTTDDCRCGQPRRASDVAGELSDGEIWWRENQKTQK